MRFALLRRRHSLTAQLLVISTGSLLIVMALIGIGTASVRAWSTGSIARDDLESHTEHLLTGMRFDADKRLVAVKLPYRIALMYDGLPKDVAYRVLDAAGTTLFVSEQGPALETLKRQPFSLQPAFGRLELGGGTLRVMSMPVQLHEATYIIQVARSERLASLLLSNNSEIVLVASAVTMTLGVAIFCLLVVWTSRRILKPLRDVSTAAASIQPRNLTTRLDGQQLPSELTPLIDAFNAALERLERGYRVQQQFLGSAAHELKTPLSLIRGAIEMGGGTGRERLLADVDFMARQVHQLLHLAEASEARNFMFDALDVTNVMLDAATNLARLAERHEVSIDALTPDAPVRMRADQGALFILIKNLLENAIQHSPPDGAVTIRVNLNGMTIRNTGFHIAPQDFENLFTRFWRAPGAAHEGAGLGLAICKEIAIAHGWLLEARNLDDPSAVEFHIAFRP